ncbi:hypothetical protein L208DRAFT_1373987 [Tricholoma matsutake]|nr:hypothetical protein L208DRAFT_1373987 [Tricholoma matsutake 945]
MDVDDGEKGQEGNVDLENTHGEREGKVKVKGKEKRMAVATETEDVGQEGDEESGLEEYQAPTVEINTMGGIYILFGVWNTQPQVESKAWDLAKLIIKQKF